MNKATISTKVNKATIPPPVAEKDIAIPILTLKLIIYVHQSDKVKVVAG